MPSFKHAPPKYVQIGDHIRQQILTGALALGDEVPSERQLAAEWGVARPTATKALNVLRQEGLVAGRPGAGTFVVGPTSFHRRADERYRRSAETGRIYPANERAEILSAATCEAPSFVAEALHLTPPSLVLRRARRTLRDGAPVELSISWFDAAIVETAPRLAETDRILEGTVAYVQRSSGRHPWKARDRLGARLAAPEEAQLLELDPPAAVLVTRHLVLDQAGEPLEFAESVAPTGAWTVEHEYLVGI